MRCNNQIIEACKILSNKYSGKSINDLRIELEIDNPLYDKGIASAIALAIFDKNDCSDLLSSKNVYLRTMQLYGDGQKKFDLKLFEVDFDEILDQSITFEESQFYSYFKNTNFIFAIYEIPQQKEERLRNNIFIGFKPLSFDDDFINNSVRATWNEIRDLVNNNKLKDVVQLDSSGMPKMNISGTVQSAPNFPKAKDNIVFLRGGGRDSSDKRLLVNGIAMLKQYAWVRGDYVAKELSYIKYI